MTGYGAGVGALGGAGSSGDLNIPGGTGIVDGSTSAFGGSTIMGSFQGVSSAVPGLAHKFNGTNYGGGSGFSNLSVAASGGGGGAAIRYVSAPSIPGPVSVTVGAGGTTGGPAPEAPNRSNNGAAGVVIVEEFY
jgi:hypothetical protein